MFREKNFLLRQAGVHTRGIRRRVSLVDVPPLQRWHMTRPVVFLHRRRHHHRRHIDTTLTTMDRRRLDLHHMDILIMVLLLLISSPSTRLITTIQATNVLYQLRQAILFNMVHVAPIPTGTTQVIQVHFTSRTFRDQYRKFLPQGPPQFPMLPARIHRKPYHTMQRLLCHLRLLLTGREVQLKVFKRSLPLLE